MRKQRDPAEPGTLKSLGERLKKARAEHEEPTGPETGGQAGQMMSAAWRMTIELVVAPAACGAFGWWLDEKLGTRPWIMFVLLLLGFIAGGVNAYRAAQRIARDPALGGQGPRRETEETRSGDQTDADNR